MDLTWKSWFAVGDARIDNQHRLFLDLIRRLDSQARAGDRVAQGRTLAEVAAYANFHFLTEENLMAESGHPGAADHIAAHARITATLGDMMADFAAGDDNGEEIVTFLYDWFTGHTVNEDQALARHLATVT